MTVAFAISAVPQRLQLAEALAAELPAAAIYVDDPPTGSSWPNYRAAMLDAGGSDTDWLVKLDEDSILCRNFAYEVTRALAACPGDFAEFYFGGPNTLDRVAANGSSWLAIACLVYGLAWAIRTPLAESAAEYGDRVPGLPVYQGRVRGGQRLHAWLMSTGRFNFVTVPNLVDHRQDQMSLLSGRPSAGERSALFETDPSSVVWKPEVTVAVANARESSPSPLQAKSGWRSIPTCCGRVRTCCARPV